MSRGNRLDRGTSSGSADEGERTSVVIIGAEMPNTGDASIVLAEVDVIRRALGPAVDIVVFDQWVEISKQLYPELEQRPALVWPRPGQSRERVTISIVLRVAKLLVAATLLRARLERLTRFLIGEADYNDLQSYRHASLIVTAGGTALLPQYMSLGRLIDYIIVFVLGRPLVFYTQSLSPFTRPWQKRAMRMILRRARLVLVRGDMSAATVAALGVSPSRTAIAADAAFGLLDPNATRSGTSAVTPQEGLRVALSVREWAHFAGGQERGQHEYERAVGVLISHLVERRRAHVTLMSTCQGLDHYPIDDAVVARRIADGLDPRVAAHVVVDTNHRTPVELMEALDHFDLAVATRMHFGILAWCAGTPAMPIAYGDKAHEVYDRLGQDDVADIDGITGAQLIERVDAYLSKLDHLRPALFAKVESEAASARAVAELLRRPPEPA